MMGANTSSHDFCATKLGRQTWVATRRVLLKSSVTALAALPLSCAPQPRLRARPGAARFGIVADCHYADADAAGTRFYRESLDKLTECVTLMNAQKLDFLIELGDFKDQDRTPVEQKTLCYLEAVERVFRGCAGPRYHVLGNHDMDSISKRQFLGRVENTNVDPGRSYYSFDVNGLRFVVLDANYRSDGADYDHGDFDWTDANIPADELTWLKRRLDEAPGPVIVFIHQLLDGVGSVYVKNAADVRPILQSCGKVLAVFQGHHHPGSYSNMAGIHYYALRALVEGTGLENNSCAIAEVHPDGNIVITGYWKTQSRQLAPSPAPVPYNSLQAL
jgi:alkaline phosphatase